MTPTPPEPAPERPAHLARPLFHLTPRRHWMNDPNGLVHHGGLWHVYFQHNPSGPDWGNMSWGHATSPDLVSWTEHPVALPCREGEQMFSGSMVATPGAGDGALTALYTSAYADGRQAQSRATSTDGGYVWEQDPANPVLDRGSRAFRDPKVVRHTGPDGRQRWVMAAVEADDRQVLFFASDDLGTWEHLSTLGPFGPEGVVWECPDLVRLPVDDDPDDTRWVLLLSTNPVGEDRDGSSMSYLLGTFDGRVFTPDTDALTRLDHGRDFYAAVTFADAPGGDAVALGWMSNWRYAAAVPTSPWRGAMSLPRRLALRTVGGRVRLVQEPYGFAAGWRGRRAPVTVTCDDRPVELRSSGHLLADLRWDPASTGSLTVTLRDGAGNRASVQHDPAAGELRVARGGPGAEALHPDFPGVSSVALGSDAPVRADEPVRTAEGAGVAAAELMLSLDGPLLEVFLDGGVHTVSDLVPLAAGPVTVSIRTDRPGPVTLRTLDAADEPVKP